MSLTDGATKKSLYLQVAWPPKNLVEMLDHVRDFHKDPNKDDYIFNLVLDEIGNEFGLHESTLDLVEPHFSTFDNIFVGSHYVPWQGNGYAYREGMANGSHRWANLTVQKELWADFVRRYPDLYAHWYINHEGVLDYFDIPATRAGYEAFLIQSVRDGHDILPDRAVLWSPAIWSGKPLTNVEELEIGRTFRNVRDWSQKYGHYAGVSWLHFQDMMGRGRADVTRSDVRQWYQELKKVYEWDSLRVNMEMFTKDDNGHLIVEDPAVIQAREDWYQANGVVVGTSWEIRQWFDTHKEL